jgi:hypothetical protein
MEVILYARSAMEDPCDPQCPKQLQDCRDYVQSKGWSISAEYCDPGVAGTPGVQKKGLATAIAALRAGSVLLVIGVNRLSRDSRELDSLLMRIKSLGARVIGVEDAFDSNHASPLPDNDNRPRRCREELVAANQTRARATASQARLVAVGDHTQDRSPRGQYCLLYELIRFGLLPKGYRRDVLVPSVSVVLATPPESAAVTTASGVPGTLSPSPL